MVYRHPAEIPHDAAKAAKWFDAGSLSREVVSFRLADLAYLVLRTGGYG